MLDHRQGAAGVAVDDHGHIAVPFAHRGLIDQQHRAAAAAAPLSNQGRPRVHQGAHTVPVHTVPSRHRVERHHLRVSDQPPRQTPRQRALERRMALQEAAVAVVAHHPAPRPHQHRAPSRHLQVADLLVAAVMHPAALEPALRTAQPQQRRLDAHHQRARSVLDHLQHTDLRQVQPNCHNIASHRGPPGSLISQSPIPAGPRPLLRDPQPPTSPRFREGSSCSLSGQGGKSRTGTASAQYRRRERC